MGSIYKNFDQTSLNYQYDNLARSQVSRTYITYCNVQSKRVRNELNGTLNIRYGNNDDEVLDIFSPADLGDLSRPVQVFIHGGYWRALHKDDASYVAKPIVDAGAISVVINYTLIPIVRMETLVNQCRASLAWVYKHIAKYGGDPDRIYLSGHSAGGHLVAQLMSDTWQQFDDVPENLVKGGVAISGVFDLQPIQLCHLNDELFLTDEEVKTYSPLRHLPDHMSPLVLGYGVLESEEFAHQSGNYADLLKEKGFSCELIPINGHHHMSIMASFGDSDSEVVKLIKQQMGYR